MNWITRIIKASDKIKSAIKKRVSKEEIKNSKWMSPCCGSNPILKSSIFNEKELNTCPNCDKHYPFPPRQRFDHFYGANNWEEIDTPKLPDDPLNWPGGVYKKKLASARKLTNQRCSVLVALGERDGIKITSFAINSSFIGGAISVESAEAILKACDVAIENKTPLLAWSEGGGQIMFESGLSLQGMARTVLGVSEVKKNNLPYINIYTNKCYGGISASFCGVSDIAFAEKSTMIGFAGQHIVKNQTREELPENFQSSQELMRTGFLDAEFHRKEINDKIMTVLKILLKKKDNVSSEQDETVELSMNTQKAS
ncbi:acetyl-CoA carboxylase carboxyl transferase subunit beta [Candidatus Pelagibacter sp.]|nr:acetyl-CoA carboxylase carboxyl transferase subunit beta [Candidatus Pelagibacter sp.]